MILPKWNEIAKLLLDTRISSITLNAFDKKYSQKSNFKLNLTNWLQTKNISLQMFMLQVLEVSDIFMSWTKYLQRKTQHAYQSAVACMEKLITVNYFNPHTTKDFCD